MNYADDYWQFSDEFHSGLSEECMMYRIVQIGYKKQMNVQDAADFANALLMGGEMG